MKKRIFFALMIFIAIMSISVISASEIDVNDTYLSQDNSIDVISVDSDVDSNSNNLSVNNIFNENTVGANDSSKKAVKIDAPNIDLYYKNGTKLIANLSDIDGNILANQSLIFTISGVNYTRVTNSQGQASISINLIPGIYNVDVSYLGTDTYLDSKVTTNVTVLHTISGNNIVKYYKNGTQFYAQFLDGTGSPLVNTSVIYNINGVFYNRTTNESGFARLNINLQPNTYILTAYHPVTNYSYSNTISVLDTVYMNNLTKIYRDSNQFYAQFLDGVGSPLVNTSVIYNINGVFYNRTTNESGFARLNINLQPNTYILTAYHPTDASRASSTIKILSSSTTSIATNDYTFYVNDTKVVNATLYNQLGYGISNQNITITVNGSSYKVSTDSDGVASVSLNLSSGVYTVRYSYSGTSPYSSSTNTSTITVKNAHQASFMVNNTVIYYNNSESFEVNVLNENKTPIVGENVYFTINGQTYSRTTDDNGTAKLKINLNTGIYPIEYKFNSTNYEELSQSSLITVISTNTSTLTGSNTTIGKGYGGKFYVTLKAGDVGLAQRNVTFNINGVNYTRVTDDSGVAALTINLNIGSYLIKYYYNGEDRISESNGQAYAIVKERTATSLVWSGTSTYTTGTTSNLKVLLSDASNTPINGANVTFTISSNDYTVQTNTSGIASLDLTLSKGSYSISYKYDGDNDYAQSEGITQVNVVGTTSNGYGYWLQGKDMYNVNLSTLASLGTGNIFLNFYAFTLYGESNVSSWIKTANSQGIKVHIWMQTFYDGGWINPVSGGSYNQTLFTQKINEAKYYAGLSGVAGIHLDYLRYAGNAYKTSGGAAAISEFVKQVTTAVKEVNSNIIISAAVMPETTNNIYYYGQDIPTISRYLDVIVPMQYKGNYNAGSSWLTSTTSWFIKNSNGAEIWSGLQSYVSDDDLTKLLPTEITNDVQTVVNAGAKGAVLFRWGLSNFVDFNNLNNPSYGSAIEIKDILNTATNLKSHIESNGTLPTNINVGSEVFTIPQVLAMMSQTIVLLNNKSSDEIVALLVSSPNNSSGDDIHSQLQTSDYIKVAQDVYNYCSANNMAPNNVNSSIGSIKYETLIYAQSRILAYYNINKVLPSFVLVNNLLDNYNITVTMLPSYGNDYQYINYTTTWLNFCPDCGYYGTLLINPKGTYEGELTCYHCGVDYCGVSGHEKDTTSSIVLTRLSESVPSQSGDVGNNISIASIVDAAVYLKEYIESNSKLPDSIVLANAKYSLPQFLYLMSEAIVKINSSDRSATAVISVNSASSPTGDVIDSDLAIASYIDVANRVAKFIESYLQAPNYASSTVGKIIYSELLDSFSRVLTYYDSNGYLPSTVHIIFKGETSQSISDLSKSLTDGLNSTRDKAVALYNYVRDKISYSFYYNTQKGAEKTLTSKSGNCCDQAQLLVAMARSVNLTVRFATGYCTFSSGSTYGHVWVQFNIDGTWINADPTSSRNSFGVINNWNTRSYTSRGTFDILPY